MLAHAEKKYPDRIFVTCFLALRTVNNVRSLYFWIVTLGWVSIHNPVFCSLKFAGKRDYFWQIR